MNRQHAVQMIPDQSGIFAVQHRGPAHCRQRRPPRTEIPALGQPAGKQDDRCLHPAQCRQRRPDVGALGVVNPGHTGLFGHPLTAVRQPLERKQRRANRLRIDTNGLQQRQCRRHIGQVVCTDKPQLSCG